MASLTEKSLGAYRRSGILVVDGIINILLGTALLLFRSVGRWLGIPPSEGAFYPMILGAVLFGIGLALLLECARRAGGS